jgi:hypothetical protein
MLSTYSTASVKGPMKKESESLSQPNTSDSIKGGNPVETILAAGYVK